MSNSSTKYLDMMVLDEKGEVVKDVMESIKGYCGFFAFILSVGDRESISNEEKSHLIKQIIESSLLFMSKKYETNLKLYHQHVTENLDSGNKFEKLSLTPAKMREDFEMGLEEARRYLYIEARDIIKILKLDLEI